MLTNYHTHCERCKHAEGSVEDYVKQAVAEGYDVLGMSDHLPYPDYDYGYRMDFGEINDYIGEVRAAQAQFGGRLKLLLGFEGEYLREYRKYYEELFTRYGVEYLILGQHFYDINGYWKSAYDIDDTEECLSYARSISEGLGTGYYSLLAHPDIVGVNRLPWDKNMEKMTDIIIESALKHHIPLEINANGIRRGIYDDRELGMHYMYPHYKFWEKAAEAKAEVIISADCHNPALLNDADVQRCRDIARNWGLNVIERLVISG